MRSPLIFAATARAHLATHLHSDCRPPRDPIRGIHCVRTCDYLCCCCCCCRWTSGSVVTDGTVASTDP